MMEEIGGMKHEAFQYAQSLTRQGGRDKSGCYLAESLNLTLQALASPSKTQMVFATQEEAAGLREPCKAQGVPLYVLRGGLMQKLVGTGYETATTAIAVVEKRLLREEELPCTTETLLLAGENIQDPRNVGVLARTAESAGCAALVLSEDSAEPFSRAATRSTTGSILRLPLCLVPRLSDTLRRYQERGGATLASSAHALQTAYEANLAQRPLLVVVGNETQGISEEAQAAAGAYVALPMSPNGASSLNVTVAAGILLYEAVRQRSTST
jgi:TrmH family RNA methyltransferase